MTEPPSFDVRGNCYISLFEVTLQQLIEFENGGGNYRALWLDAEDAVKLFVPEASTTTLSHKVTVWHQLRHPNVKLYGEYDVGHYFFACEWTSNGSLVEYLSALNPWQFVHQAALGLAYLHECNIVYGNLCNDSIPVGGDGLAKLADF
ncbi:Serine/threonine protein kinase [Phytophthora megakarya]|uniref:Serine/threonine protein kinase n=1 Tax=Phytophthora megakarya TaxID=4795 RepID=A0A225WGQ7_9STRA|nr:Serine/threonine protein kinase [Phytophthora megakarya]